MTTNRMAMMVLLGGWLALSAAACNDDPAPTQFPTVMGGDGVRLRPIKVTKRDKAIVASVSGGGGGDGAGTESGGQPNAEQPAGDGEAVAIDDSTPQALANSVTEILRKVNLWQLPAVVVPAQVEEINRRTRLIQPLIDAQSSLKLALTEKFPGHAFQLAPIGAFKDLSGAMPSDISIGEVTSINDDEAEAPLTASGAAGSASQKITFRRVEGKWRIEFSELKQMTPIEEEKVAGLVMYMVDAIALIQQKLKDDEYADGEAAEQAIGQTMQEAVENFLKGVPSPQASGTGSNAAPDPEVQQLAEIGKAIYEYARSHGDQQPDSLKQLVEVGLLEASQLKLERDTSGSEESFVYIVNPSSATITDPDLIVAYERRDLVGSKGIHVLFMDSHVEVMPLARFEVALKTTMDRLGQKPTDGQGASQENQPQTQQPKPRQRDEVDESYSGPGMLRAR